MPKASGKFTVRRAAIRDLDALVYQRRGMWEDIGKSGQHDLEAADRSYRRWARSKLKTGKLVGWVAEDSGGKIVGGGCVWLQPEQPRPGTKWLVQPYLLSMYTEPKFRGRGVASKIVKEAVKWAKANGFPSLTLHASHFGCGIYRKHGFNRTWEMKRDLRNLRSH